MLFSCNDIDCLDLMHLEWWSIRFTQVYAYSTLFIVFQITDKVCDNEK